MVPLPAPEELLRRCVSLAILDHVFHEGGDDFPELSYFAEGWEDGVRVFVQDAQQGDHVFVVVARAGAFVKGFAHESEAAANDVLVEGFPDALDAIRNDPSLMPDDLTFLYWWDGERWRRGLNDDVDDGASELLERLDGDPKTYVRFAAEYYQREIPRAAVAAVYAHRPLDDELVRELLGRDADKAELASLRKTARAYGYGRVD